MIFIYKYNHWEVQMYTSLNSEIKNILDPNETEYDSSEDVITILEFMMIVDSGDMLLAEERGESVKNLFAKVSSKLGFAAKNKKNLLGLLGSIGQTGAKAILYSIQATAGNEGAKEKLAQVLKNSNAKSEIIDFVIRADVLTLHLISTPIHMIDAIAGFDIAEKIREKAVGGGERLKDAVDLIQKSAKNLGNPSTARKVKKSLNTINRAFSLKAV